jgi:hypothetical protein
MTLQILKLPIIKDVRGNLTYFENRNQIPFDIKFIRWIPVSNTEVINYKSIYDDNLIIALTGSFELDIINNIGELKKFSLNRSYNAIHFTKDYCLCINNMSTNSLILIVGG